MGLEEGSDQGQAVPDIGEKVIMDLTVSSLTSVILCGLWIWGKDLGCLLQNVIEQESGRRKEEIWYVVPNEPVKDTKIDIYVLEQSTRVTERNKESKGNLC